MDQQKINNEGLPESSAPEVKPEVKKEPPKSVQPKKSLPPPNYRNVGR